MRNIMKKISLLSVCVMFLCLTTYSSMQVHAKSCEHDICSVVLNMATGKHKYAAEGHYTEYGSKYTCTACGYTFYRETYFEYTENHYWQKETDKKFRCTTAGCGYVLIKE